MHPAFDSPSLSLSSCLHLPFLLSPPLAATSKLLFGTLRTFYAPSSLNAQYSTTPCATEGHLGGMAGAGALGMPRPDPQALFWGDFAFFILQTSVCPLELGGLNPQDALLCSQRSIEGPFPSKGTHVWRQGPLLPGAVSAPRAGGVLGPTRAHPSRSITKPRRDTNMLAEEQLAEHKSMGTLCPDMHTGRSPLANCGMRKTSPPRSRKLFSGCRNNKWIKISFCLQLSVPL